MKKYAVFAGEPYYPSGGWGDFKESFDDLEDAEISAGKYENAGKWTHIINLETGEWI